MDLLMALNTGHAGSSSTVHANAPGDVIARFVALGTLAGVPPTAVERQVAAGLDAVVHVARDGRGRYVESAAVVAFGVPLGRRLQRGRRALQAAQAVPEACEQVARALRSGERATAALRAAAAGVPDALAARLREAANTLDLGGSAAASLRRD